MNKLLDCYLRKYILLCIIITCGKLINAQGYFPGGLSRAKFNLWLDATDSSTLTVSNGVVTRWRDKANNLQADAPATTNAPVINNDLIAGKRLLQFQGNKVLLVNDNARLDPNSGFNVMQVVHLHNDISNSYSSATDFRVGTFSRGENPFTNVPIGTASIAVRYIQGVNDNRYRVGLMRNSSTVMIGFNNQRFDDLAGSTHLLENYTTGFTNGDTIITTQLNAAAAINGNYKFVNSTQQLGIGNRPTLYASVHWSIGETIFTGSSLGKCGKKILNAYLFYKWQLQRNIPNDVAAIFSPLDTIFTNNLIGIGMEGAIDSVNGNATNNGMGFQNAIANGFLREVGDYIIAADNNASGTVTLGTSFTRWNRVWYVNKTDVAGLGGNLRVFFDFATYGIANQLDTITNRYYLLYNSNSATFSNGTNYLIPVVNASRLSNTSQFHFTVNGLHLSNGYYTIVYANRNIDIAQIPRIGNFSNVSMPALRAPILEVGFAGNTYNYLRFNIDDINYSVQSFKIYVSTNGGPTTLLDSISGNNLFYAHYQVTNGFSYSYCIKAVYASGIESEFSNAITLIPTVYIPTWRTLPQYAGARSVMMEASQPLPTAPSKFQFENITTNSTSTWLTSSQFREHNLLQGQTYNYRFRVMDTIHGNITTSGWSPVASVSIVDSAKGGFTYKFAFIDNNSIAPPNGIGPITYNLLQMDTSGLRFIKHVPPAGVHPRIYCNPEDSMDIKWRLTNTASGRALAKYIHANTVLLQLGAGVFNGNANYNRDTLGVAIISNQGFSNVKPWYDSLALGDIGVLHNFSNLWGGASGRLAAQLAHEAFECWLYKGTIDRVTNTSYVVRAEKLARAITVWCTKALADNSNPLSFQNRDRIANLQMAMIYDFLYDQMTVAQRDTVRKALLAIAPTDISDLNLHNTPSYTATSNWATFGYEIMATLAVEDEVGYTPQHAVALQTYIRIVLNFLNYGIYESTGNMVEGLGKNQLNAALMVALAKRGYSMLGHPSIRAFATKFWPSIIQPFGYSMVGSDLLGGTGLNSAAYGGWRDRIFDIIGLKWAYPRDNTIDFIWKNFVQRAHAGSNGSNHYYFYQDAFRTSLSQPTYWNHLYAPAFITDYSASTIGSQAQQVYNNNHVYFDSIGGMATIRSGSGLQSAALFFHNRQDMGGHPYGNKNDIVYSALGRIWITRVTTNANSNYYRTAYTGASSGVLVNNAGASVDTTIDRTEEMMVVPGKVIAFNQQPSIVTIAGDARDAYSYIWHGAFGGFQNHHPLLGNTYKKVTRSLNSFRYAPYYSFDNIPLYDKLAVTNYAWNANSPYYNRYVQTTYVNGIMRKVFRTAAMIMDTRPYVIIADDVQKDSSINNFKWVAQIANDLTIEARIIDSSASGFRNDIIFREPSATGNRRFLVRVLNNNNPFDAILPGYIDSIINPVSNITPNNRLPRLVIESNSIDPQFRILLLAYSQGEALPITTWNTDRTRLIVNNNGTTRVIAFDVDSAGRTNISLIEGSLSLAIKATAVKTPHHVKVKWQVSEVKEVASFLVQRSSDGIHYITIDTTYVNDNTTLFQIQDADPIDGKNYYRVMAKLKVGSYKVSNTVLIEFTTDITINITPNPIIHNELTVQLPKLQSSINHKHVIQIFNQFGIKVYSTFIQAAGGSSVKLLLPTYLPQGTYMLIISNDVRNYKAKFLKL